LTET